MSVSPVGLVEMLFFFSIPLVWAIWELRKLSRDRARDAAKAADDKDDTAP